MLIVQHLCQLILFFIILLGPLPLCMSLILITEKEKKRPNLLHCLLLLLTGWCIIEAWLGLFLGIIQLFTLNSVLISEFVAFLIGVMFYTHLKSKVPPLFLQNLLSLRQRLSKFETVILGAISFIGVFLLWTLATQPILDYDSLAYHLPAMAKWYQTASLAMPEAQRFIEIGRYPYNWEVLCTLFLMPFQEDFLVALPNYIAWIIIGLSVYLLSIEIGAVRIYGMMASCLVLTLPSLIESVYTMHIDLPFASFFMVSLYLLYLYNRTWSITYLVLFFPMIGMLFGIKTSGVIYGFILLAILGIIIFKAIFIQKKSTRTVFRLSKHTVILSIVSISCFLFLGWFWYLRNLVEVGNPLGYVKVRIGNSMLFSGTIDSTEVHRSTLAYAFDSTKILHWKLLAMSVLQELQVPFLLMVFLIFLLTINFILGRKKQVKFGHFIAVMTLLIITGFLYWNTPYTGDGLNNSHHWLVSSWSGQFRYAFPFMGVLGVATAGSATSIRIQNKYIVTFVLVSSILAIISILLTTDPEFKQLIRNCLTFFKFIL